MAMQDYGRGNGLKEALCWVRIALCRERWQRLAHTDPADAAREAGRHGMP